MKKEVYHLLKMIQRLGPDWNDEGAYKIPESVIYHCFYLLEQLSEIPEIIPSGKRSIHLTFSTMEFEVFSNKIYVRKRNEQVWIPVTLNEAYMLIHSHNISKNDSDKEKKGDVIKK